MTSRLGSCTAARTVTLIAVSSTTGIVSPRAAQEGCGGMTGTAVQRGRDVGRVGLGIHTNRCRTIMAGCTIINDAGMIEPGPDEAGSCMADATVLVCWYMSA